MWKYTTAGGLQELPTMEKPEDFDNYSDFEKGTLHQLQQSGIEYAECVEYEEHIAGLRNIPANLCEGFTSEDEGKEFSENEAEIVYQVQVGHQWIPCSKKEYDETDLRYRQIVARKKVVDKEQDELWKRKVIEFFDAMKNEYQTLKGKDAYERHRLMGYSDCLWDMSLILKDQFGIIVKF